jgi:ribonuclease-3
MLSRVAEELGIDDYLLLSRGEQKDAGKARQYIWANAVEAVIGAVYLDAGYDAAKKLIEQRIITKLAEVIEKGLHIDNKSRFQELSQEKFRVTPSYRVIHEEGLDHAKHFVVGVFVDNQKMGEGNGSSKQEAQQAAAKQAIEKIGKTGS